MMNVRLLGLGILVLSAAWCLAEKPARWFNRAGHAIEGTPEQCTQGRVTFTLANATSVTYPLQSFPPEEQLRIQLALGQCPIPSPLRSAWSITTRALQRARGLGEALQQPQAEIDAQETALRAVLHQRIDALPELTEAHRQALHQKVDTL